MTGDGRHVEDLGSLHIRTCRLHVALPELVWVGHQRTSSTAYGHRFRASMPDMRVVQVTLRGAGVLCWRGQDQVVAEGYGFVYVPGDPQVAFHWAGEWAYQWEQLVVFLGGGSTRELIDALIADSGPVVALPPERPSVRALLDLAHQGGHERALEAAESASLAGALLADLCGSRRDEGDHHRELLHLAERAAGWMQRHQHEALKLPDIARGVGTTESYLSRACQLAYGLAPWAFLTRLRMRTACGLLRSGEMPIAEVAARVGYTQKSFARAFTRHVGHNPLAYRAGDGGPVV